MKQIDDGSYFEFMSPFGEVHKYPTIKELINMLSLLDQDKLIYVSYDGGCYKFPPLPDETDEDGDYVIIAG